MICRTFENCFITYKTYFANCNFMNRKILRLAIPSIISNITVPLLGLIDVSIVGHLGAASYIGAIAVGGMLFNIIYWIFGFLRMGTSGMTAQAYGKYDMQEVILLLIRSVGVGLFIASGLLLFQHPIQKAAFTFLESSPDVEQWATLYYSICIWGAPAVLGLYGFSGWFLGMQNSRYPMYIAIIQNIVNIITSVCFVFLLGMKVEGVAFGTLIAQYCGFFTALVLWFKHYRKLQVYIQWKKCIEKYAMSRFFAVNSDIFFRTLCLVVVTTFFTYSGAKQGDIVLAVNTLLMQLFTLFSYIMDGFAHAGEALTGRYIGAKDKKSLYETIRLLFRWGIGLALFFTTLYGLAGKDFFRLLTNEESVIRESRIYFYWVLAIPLSGFAAFLWDGVLIGATATRQMLYSMLIASCCFFLIYYLYFNTMGNHALWMAFLVYLSLRGIFQTFFGKKVLQKA